MNAHFVASIYHCGQLNLSEFVSGLVLLFVVLSSKSWAILLENCAVHFCRCDAIQSHFLACSYCLLFVIVWRCCCVNALEPHFQMWFIWLATEATHIICQCSALIQRPHSSEIGNHAQRSFEKHMFSIILRAPCGLLCAVNYFISSWSVHLSGYSQWNASSINYPEYAHRPEYIRSKVSQVDARIL